MPTPQYQYLLLFIVKYKNRFLSTKVHIILLLLILFKCNDDVKLFGSCYRLKEYRVSQLVVDLGLAEVDFSVTPFFLAA